MLKVDPFVFAFELLLWTFASCKIFLWFFDACRLHSSHWRFWPPRSSEQNEIHSSFIELHFCLDHYSWHVISFCSTKSSICTAQGHGIWESSLTLHHEIRTCMIASTVATQTIKISRTWFFRGCQCHGIRFRWKKSLSSWLSMNLFASQAIVWYMVE